MARAIRDKARKEGLSLNRTVARLLVEATGQGERGRRRPVIHQDLERFFGVWSADEAAEFDEALRQQRQIEPDMWK